MRSFKIFSRWRHLLFSISQFNSRNPYPKPNPNPNPKPNPASLRARIGNYATQHGTAAATRHFEQELKRKLPESTANANTDKSVTANAVLINLQSTNSPLFQGIKNRQIKTPPNF